MVKMRSQSAPDSMSGSENPMKRKRMTDEDHGPSTCFDASKRKLCNGSANSDLKPSGQKLARRYSKKPRDQKGPVKGTPIGFLQAPDYGSSVADSLIVVTLLETFHENGTRPKGQQVQECDPSVAAFQLEDYRVVENRGLAEPTKSGSYQTDEHDAFGGVIHEGPPAKFLPMACIRLQNILASLNPEDAQVIASHTKAIKRAQATGDKAAYYINIPGEGRTLIPYSVPSIKVKGKQGKRGKKAKQPESWKAMDDMFNWRELSQEHEVDMVGRK